MSDTISRPMNNAISNANNMMKHYKAGRVIYKNFCDEIQNKRFTLSYDNCNLLKILSSYCKSYLYELENDSLLYRARKFNEFNNEKSLIEFENLKKIFCEPVFLSEFKKNLSECSQIKTEMVEKNVFSGLPKDESGAPPASTASEGRCNPQGVSYLYASEDYETCCYEVRPLLGGTISVATLKTKRSLYLLDSTKEHVYTNSKDDSIFHVFTAISEAFSIPNHFSTLDFYLPTQIISEHIKNSLGLDGIRYKSSLRKTGHNILLFSHDCYEVVSSEIYEVENITMELNKKYIQRSTPCLLSPINHILEACRYFIRKHCCPAKDKNNQ